MSIMTSLLPSSHGMLDQFSDVLAPGIKTLPGTLRDNGYDTIFVGPDFNDPTMPYAETRYGFDRSFGTPMADVSGWQRGLGAFSESVSKGRRAFLFLHTYFVHDPYLTDDPTDRSQFPGKPFSVPINSDEYSVYDRQFRNVVLEQIGRDIRVSDGDALVRLARIRDAFVVAETSKDIEQAAMLMTEPERAAARTLRYDTSYDYNDPKHISFIRSLYDKRIWQFDRQFGAFLAWLKDSGLTGRTVVIVTSDHGEEFMEHGQMNHGHNVYAPQTRVPFIVSVPGMNPKRIDVPVEGIDIFPTLFGIIGLDQPVGLQGRNLTPLFAGKEVEHRSVVSQRRGGVAQVVRDEQWSLYISEDGATALYDRVADPEELRNVAAEHQPIVERMRRLMQERISSGKKYVPMKKPYPMWLDAGKRRQMMERGYFW